MEVHVRDDSKLVEVWLTHKEQQDQTIKQQLNPLYQQYKAKKYLVAVFESGSQDLWEETSALLRCNKRRSAELEAKQARKNRAMLR